MTDGNLTDTPGVPRVSAVAGVLEPAAVRHLVVHCSATPDTDDIGAREIHAMHLGFGWHGIGYHRVIRRDGRVEAGRPDCWVGAHVYGHNTVSLGVCLIGCDTFTEAQFDALEAVLREWRMRCPHAAIRGHRDFAYTDKTCPNFDVGAWCAARGLQAPLRTVSVPDREPVTATNTGTEPAPEPGPEPIRETLVTRSPAASPPAPSSGRSASHKRVESGHGALDVIGLMSGTSVDGIDAVLVRSDGERLERRGIGGTFPYRDETLSGIRRAIESRATTAVDRAAFAPLERRIAEDHAAAIRTLLEGSGTRPSLIGFHGQTVFHDADAAVSVQLGDAGHLAVLCGIDTVHDFRAADLARGGQGAPLAPVYQRALLDGLALPRPAVLLNIGGVSNLGAAFGERLVGFDCGPGNALMDDLVRARTGCPYDKGGTLAAAGQVRTEVVAAVLADPFFARLPPRSLDRQAFARLPALSALERLSTEDALATLARITIEAVAGSMRFLPEPPRALVVAGGGQHNDTLIVGLREALAAEVHRADDVGLPGDLIEAELMAFLAVRHRRGLALTFPETTGVDAPCPGGRLVRAPHRDEMPPAS